MKFYRHRDFKFEVVAYMQRGVMYWRELEPGQKRTGSDPWELFHKFFERVTANVEFAANVREAPMGVLFGLDN